MAKKDETAETETKEETLDEVLDTESTETIKGEGETEEVEDTGEEKTTEEKETEEVAAAEEDEEETTAHMIPKSRYDSAQARARSAEKKVKEYEAQQAAQVATEQSTNQSAEKLDTRLEELDRDIEQARLDGDVDKIVALQKDARNVEKQIYQTMAELAASNAGTAAQESVKLDTLIDTLETQYDILNPDSENFNEDKINEILDMQSAFVKNGDSPSAAMLKAVGYIMPEERITDEVANKRRTNVAKNLKAAKAQAPGSNETGMNSDAGGPTSDKPVDVTQMTQEEFDALPPETIKRLRGDSVQSITYFIGCSHDTRTSYRNASESLSFIQYEN